LESFSTYDDTVTNHVHLMVKNMLSIVMCMISFLHILVCKPCTIFM